MHGKRIFFTFFTYIPSRGAGEAGFGHVLPHICSIAYTNFHFLPPGGGRGGACPLHPLATTTHWLNDCFPQRLLASMTPCPNDFLLQRLLASTTPCHNDFLPRRLLASHDEDILIVGVHGSPNQGVTMQSHAVISLAI